jgi:hypothetical protein
MLIPLLVFVAGCGGDDDDDTAASGGGGSSSSFCDRAKTVDERFAALEDSFSGDEVPSGDVFKQAADTISDLADGAPKEIKDDLETVADGVRQIADVFDDIDLSDPQALADPDNAQALQEMGDRMEAVGTKVEDASNRVEAYLKDECGIDISGDDGSSGGGADDGS